MKVKSIKCLISIKLKTTLWILRFLKLITSIVLQRECSDISACFNQKSRGGTYPTNFFKKGTVASEVDELFVEEPGKLQVKRWIMWNLTGQHNALTHGHIQVACWTRDHSCLCKWWKTCHIIITASFFSSFYLTLYKSLSDHPVCFTTAYWSKTAISFVCSLNFDK